MSCSRGLGLLCARPVCVRYPSTLPAPVPSQSPPRDLGASHSLTIAALSRAAVCFVRSMALDKELQAAQLLEYHTSLHSAASRLGEECWLRRLERRCFGLRCRKLGRERPVRALFVRAVRGALVTPSGRRGRRPTLGGGPANGVGDHISGCEITGDRRVNGLQRPTRQTQRRGVAFERRPGYACQYAHGGPQGGAHWRWSVRVSHRRSSEKKKGERQAHKLVERGGVVQGKAGGRGRWQRREDGAYAVDDAISASCGDAAPAGCGDTAPASCGECVDMGSGDPSASAAREAPARCCGGVRIPSANASASSGRPRRAAMRAARASLAPCRCDASNLAYRGAAVTTLCSADLGTAAACRRAAAHPSSLRGFFAPPDVPLLPPAAPPCAYPFGRSPFLPFALRPMDFPICAQGRLRASELHANDRFAEQSPRDLT